MTLVEGRGFLDQDYVRDERNIIYRVLGSVHPKGRVISFPKYVFTGKGTWMGYERLVKEYGVVNVYKALDELKGKLIEYFVPDKVYNRKVFSVPEKRLVKRYLPESWPEAAKSRALDPLEERALRLIRALSDVSGVPSDSFGVTGSLLLGIHNTSFSDINLVVYGEEEALSVKRSMIEGRVEGAGIRRLSEEEILKSAIRASRSRSIPLPHSVKLYRFRWRKGVFEGRAFSITPVPKPDEITSTYGDMRFYPTVPITIKAKVVRDLSLFYPHVCEIGEVEVINGPEVYPIVSVISYEGLYSDVMIEGGIIEARGLLQRVKEGGRTYYSVAVGVSEVEGGGYILLLEP